MQQSFLVSAKSIVIVSASRTGSTLVWHNLYRHFIFEFPVFHTHNALVDVTADQMVVISRRQNNFDTIVSNLVGQHTKEFDKYTGKNIGSFFVSKDKFEKTFWYVLYHQHMTQTRFTEAVIVEFEPLINDSLYLFGLFGIAKETDYPFSQQSPHRACDLIENYVECKSWFSQLKEETLCQTMMDNFISVLKQMNADNCQHK